MEIVYEYDIGCLSHFISIHQVLFGKRQYNKKNRTHGTMLEPKQNESGFIGT